MTEAPAPFRALLFDLDNTLFSPTSLPQSFLRRLFDGVRAASRATGVIDDDVLQEALDTSLHVPIDIVAEQFRLPAPVQDAWRTAMRDAVVTDPLLPFDDVWSIRALPGRKHLVTTGYRRFQESKVAALGIAGMFDAVHIDAVDEASRAGKESIFRRILDEAGFAPGEAVVIGDSAQSEIAAASRIGIPSIQVLRDGVAPAANATIHVRSLHELPVVLGRLGGA